MLSSFSFFSFATVITATSVTRSSCVGTISSLDDVSSAVACTTVNINGFTVPGGEIFQLDLLDGTTVNVLGDIQFGNLSWAGPLFRISGNDITFNGNNQKWDGGGPFYWDGNGAGSSVQKPAAMMAIEMSGTLSDVYVVNSPAHCFVITNSGPITVSGVTVNDSQGSYPNSQSNGQMAARNTDGFDVNGSNVLIHNCTVINQDDCFAVDGGSNVTFADSYCSNGHGISVGSIGPNRDVSDVTISGNTVFNSSNAFRIKTDTAATNSSVRNITYIGNTATNCTQFGVLITQSYPDSAMGTPGNGVIISDVSFKGGITTVATDSGAYAVGVNCGSGSCQGIWDWSGLEVISGNVNISNTDVSGFSY